MKKLLIVLLGLIATACADPVSDKDIQALKLASISQLSSKGELAKMFHFNSTERDATDLSIEAKLRELKGQYIEWELQVENVEKITDGVYRVETGKTAKVDVRRGEIYYSNSEAHVTAHVFIQDPTDVSYLESLTPRSSICIKGRLTGETDLLNRLRVRPAILCKHGVLNVSTDVQKSPVTVQSETSAQVDTSTGVASPPAASDDSCNEIMGLAHRAQTLADICPQGRDGYIREFLLYAMQKPDRCGNERDERYRELLASIEKDLKSEAAEVGVEKFCEENRPY